MKSFITTLGKVIKLNTEKTEAEQNFDEDKKRLIIPLYQREYKWSNEKVITLLRDVNKRDKFLGLIILNEKDKMRIGLKIQELLDELIEIGMNNYKNSLNFIKALLNSSFVILLPINL